MEDKVLQGACLYDLSDYINDDLAVKDLSSCPVFCFPIFVHKDK